VPVFPAGILDHGKRGRKLTRAVSMIRTLLREDPRRAHRGGTVFSAIFWRRDLPDILVHYWRIAAKTAGGWDRVEIVLPGTSSPISRRSGRGQGGEWGIGDVFPSSDDDPSDQAVAHHPRAVAADHGWDDLGHQAVHLGG